MGDGEHISNTLKTGSMDDLGTRAKFLVELYELWLTGLDICERYDKSTPLYEEKTNELKIALKLLRCHMEKDYSDKVYRELIDTLPARARDIPD
jgi:hypothetical protein